VFFGRVSISDWKIADIKIYLNWYGCGVNMLLYHGSNTTVEKPQLIEQTRGLDFGSGFYLTTSEEQAVRFSKIIVTRRKSGSAIVSVYDFDMDLAEKSLSVHKFKNADVDWLRFVTQNRVKTYKDSEYDIVIGPVANDTLMPTIQAFLGGFINEEAAIITLKASKLVEQEGNHRLTMSGSVGVQVCLRSDRALSYIRFVKSFNVKEE
jgi:hypothetical protein